MKSVKEMVKEYFAPLQVVVAFFAIFGEIFYQMYLSLKMSSEDFQALQDAKLEDERYEGLLNEGLLKGEEN